MARRQPKPTVPKTPAQLAAWLRDTDAGRQVVAKQLDERCRVCQHATPPSPRVLVVVRRLGPLPGVEVFYETGVNVRLEELIDTQNDPISEVLAEELLIAQLPRLWKHLPNCRKQGMPFTSVTAERRLEAVEGIRTLKGLEAWQDRWTTTSPTRR